MCLRIKVYVWTMAVHVGWLLLLIKRRLYNGRMWTESSSLNSTSTPTPSITIVFDSRARIQLLFFHLHILLRFDLIRCRFFPLHTWKYAFWPCAFFNLQGIRSPRSDPGGLRTICPKDIEVSKPVAVVRSLTTSAHGKVRAPTNATSHSSYDRLSDGRPKRGKCI